MTGYPFPSILHLAWRLTSRRSHTAETRHSMRLRLAGFALCCLGLARIADAVESVEIVIPLERGRWYSVQDVYRQCNAQLGAGFTIESNSRQRVEVTPLDRAA